MINASHLIIQLHRAGKTEEAKSDLARLNKIKAEREAAQAKRKAEAEGPYHHSSTAYSHINRALIHTAKAAEIEEKKKAAMAGKRV